jgi:hypothetical protein
MTKNYVNRLKNSLTNLDCYGEGSMDKLYSFGSDVVAVFSFVESKQPKDAIKLQGSNMQFVESNGKLEVWLKHKKKSEMREIFREVKADFIDVLDDYIDRGDAYDVWEDVD